jgi:uncharacterized protein (DUF885 family)
MSCASAPKTYSPAVIAQESKRINEFFERSFRAAVDRYPEWQTYMGGKKDYDKLNDTTDEMAKKELEINKAELKELKSYNYDALDPQTQLSYRLFEQSMNESIEDYHFRFHNYPVNQMFGRHAELPSFMMNMHRVQSLDDAKAYVTRINGFNKQLTDLVTNLEARRMKGILAPKFVYPMAIDDSKNIITGRPFDKSKTDSPILADFKEKLKSLKIKNSEKADLVKALETALLNSVKPGYEALITKLTELEPFAPVEGAATALPRGKSYYANRLERMTTTDMSADEIHELGLKETERIHNEMRIIMKKVKFEGDLKEFFQYIKTSPKFVYTSTARGRAQYLSDSNKAIAKIKKALPLMFNTLPKAPLIVKAVEPYREKSAGLAFYEGPSEDGTRPGIYYVNLYDMPAATRYELEALAHHEALPGHHMQISIAKELEGIPNFRKHGGYTAYSEGWGLYAELLPKDYGFYTDPYSDFGRLAMELWRAARLVVDTAVHTKGWTRAQAIKWLDDNTSSPHTENVRAIERYIVMPGQATAYKIGMLKILELREKAKAALGAKFDIRAFHDEVLKDGAVPMSVLEEKINAWIKRI